MGFERLLKVVPLMFVLATTAPASPLLDANPTRGNAAVSTSDVVVQCPPAGIRYTGATAQGFALCLTRSRDGRRLLAYLYGGARCPGVKIDAPFGWAASRKPPAIAIRGDGSFTHNTTGGKREAAKNAVFAGKFVGSTRATGTLRAEVRLLLGGTCNTGNVRWSARRY